LALNSGIIDELDKVLVNLFFANKLELKPKVFDDLPLTIHQFLLDVESFIA